MKIIANVIKVQRGLNEFFHSFFIYLFKVYF
jgi:hypothetical protein